MSLTRLDVVVAAAPGRPDIGGPDHPMRRVTKEIAFAPEGWSAERKAKVAALFDELAPTWNERNVPERHDAVRDALARGGVPAGGVCLEVGAGTGAATPDLAAAFSSVVRTDLSARMLAHMASDGPAVRADAASLPVPDGSVDAVALVNMFLFPSEVDRVLRPDGTLIWVSSVGDATPIYLPPEEVLDALPGSWRGVTSDAGWGRWLVARRA
jgi:SAM-dependent methyltransferase